MNHGIAALSQYLTQTQSLPVLQMCEQVPISLHGYMLCDEQAEQGEEILYLWGLSQLSQMRDGGVVNALFFSDGVRPPENLGDYATNYILIEEGVELTAILSAVDAFFAAREELRKLKQHMLSSLARHFTYQAFLDEIARNLRAAVALMQVPAVRIAASTEIYTFAELSPAMEERIGEFFTTMTSEEASIQRVLGDQQGADLFIASGGALSEHGFYLLFESGPDDIIFWKEKLEIVLQALSIFIEKFYDQAIEKGDINAQFKNLLEGQFGAAGGTFVFDKTAASDSAFFFIAVVHLSRYSDDGSENSFQYYGRLAKLCQAYAYANIGRRKRFTMLFKRDKPELFTANELENINAYCREQQITICCSSAFPDLKQSRDFFAQAKAGLKLSVHQGDWTSACLSCEQVGVRLLFQEAAAGNSLSHYCIQEILDLYRWDQVSGGTLISTLRAYIHNAQNKSATAAELHISRIALQQRLDRLESVLPQPLSAYGTLMELYFSIRCLT